MRACVDGVVCIPAPQPMVLMGGTSWHDLRNHQLGSRLGEGGYTNCYPPPQYEGADSLSEGTSCLLYVSMELGFSLVASGVGNVVPPKEQRQK